MTMTVTMTPRSFVVRGAVAIATMILGAGALCACTAEDPAQQASSADARGCEEAAGKLSSCFGEVPARFTEQCDPETAAMRVAHHLAGWLRHFVWDMGHGFDLKTIDLMAWATLAFSVTGKLIVWAIALFCAGGAAS